MRRSWLTVALALALAGCGGTWRIAFRTRVAPDGRTERHVSVSGDSGWYIGEMPVVDDAGKFRTRVAPDGRTERHVSVSGDSKQDIEGKPVSMGVGKVFEVPSAGPWSTREVGQDRYVVSGTFESPAKMLTGYARRIEDTGETAPSRVEWQRKERVFYTLYEYRETVTDLVTVDRFDSAADEIIDLGIEMACQTVQRGLGDTYDVSRLTAYLRRDGRALAKSVAWALLVHASGRDKEIADTERLARVVNAMLRRRGLELDVAKLFSDEYETEAKKILTTFVADRVRLKSAPNRPLNEAERKQLAEVLLAMNDGDDDDDDDDDDDGWMEEYLIKRYGSKEKAEAATRGLKEGVFGAYFNFLGPIGLSYEFRASLVMPGQVMRTNGYLFGPSEVAWRFSGGEVYPFGHAMHATSVAYHDGAQRAVSDKSFVTSPQQVLAFESMLKAQIGEWAIIQGSLRECVKAGSLVPLAKLIDEKGAKSAVGKQAARIKQFIASGGKEED